MILDERNARRAWDAEVDREMKRLMAVGVEEAWPDLLDAAWQSHHSAAKTASDICERLHDKFGLEYVADVLNPWHVRS